MGEITLVEWETWGWAAVVSIITVDTMVSLFRLIKERREYAREQKKLQKLEDRLRELEQEVLKK